MNQNELYHFGVKGMKWGVRRSLQKIGYRQAHSTAGQLGVRVGAKIQTRKSSAKTTTPKTSTKKTETYSEKDRSRDVSMYGTKGQKRIEQRIQKGDSRKVARAKEFCSQVAIGTEGVITITDFASGGALHRTVGKKFAESYAKKKAAKSIVKIAQNHKFDPMDVAYKTIN